MRIRVRVHPGAKRSKFEMRDGELHIWVLAPAVDGKANAAVMQALSDYYRVPRTKVLLVSGETSRSKSFEVPEWSQ
ncbi:MAG: DUF167 domain-containing protein [Vicinamibacteria bacterium]